MKPHSLPLICLAGLALAAAGGRSTAPSSSAPPESEPATSKEGNLLRHVPLSKTTLHSLKAPKDQGDWFKAEYLSADERFIALVCDRKHPEREGLHKRSLCILDVVTGKRLSGLLPIGVRSLAFSPDGKTLFTTAGGELNPNAGLVAWDIPSGKRLQTLCPYVRRETEYFKHTAVSPDGKTLATCVGSQVRFYDLTSRKELRERRINCGRDNPATVSSFCFSPGGKVVLGLSTSGPGDKFFNATIRLWAWEAATGTPLWSTKLGMGLGPRIRSLTADGRLLAYSFAIRTPSRYSDEPRPPPIHKQRLVELVSGKVVLEPEKYVLAFSPDGRHLARTWRYEYILLEDLASGKPVHLFKSPLEGVSGARFVAGGRQLMTVNESRKSSMLCFWDIAAVTKPLPRPDDTSPEALGRLWATLGNEDAARARKALWALAAIPKQAVPFLSKHLRPIPKLADKEIDRLIAALDARDYAERHKAKAQLELLSRRAEAALKKSLAAPDSLEQRKLIEAILRTLNPPYRSADRLRRLRAIEALERMGTPKARKLLKEIATGAPRAPETEDAKAALRRLGKKPAR